MGTRTLQDSDIAEARTTVPTITLKSGLAALVVLAIGITALSPLEAGAQTEPTAACWFLAGGQC